MNSNHDNDQHNCWKTIVSLAPPSIIAARQLHVCMRTLATQKHICARTTQAHYGDRFAPSIEDSPLGIIKDLAKSGDQTTQTSRRENGIEMQSDSDDEESCFISTEVSEA